MSIVNDFLANFSREAIMFLATTALFGSVFAGFLADKVMGERGFGPVGNGLLIMMGICIGLAVTYSGFGPLRPAEFDRTIVMATASSTMVLLICGALKGVILSDA